MIGKYDIDKKNRLGNTCQHSFFIKKVIFCFNFNHKNSLKKYNYKYMQAKIIIRDLFFLISKPNLTHLFSSLLLLIFFLILLILFVSF